MWHDDHHYGVTHPILEQNSFCWATNMIVYIILKLFLKVIIHFFKGTTLYW